jgi:hypothetical protein
MGVNSDANNNQKPNAGASVGATQTAAAVADLKSNMGAKMQTPMGIGFGGRDIYTMSTNQGSEYTMNIGNALLETFKPILTAQRPRVTVIDKEIFTGIAYSTIVISKSDGGVVNYYTLLLEDTGRRPMKAIEITNEVNQAIKTNTRPFIFTTDDAIDSELMRIIVSALSKEYGENTEFVTVDGLVVHATHEDVATLARRIAPIAFNALNVEAALTSGTTRDLNIREAVGRSGESMLKIESNMGNPVSRDESGRPVRTDWRIELLRVNTQQQFHSLNADTGRQTLAAVSGYIDAIPDNVQTQVPGMPMVSQLRLKPHIVITSDAVAMPTTGFALLGLIAGMVMTQKNMWMAALTPRNDRTPGVLNMITNLEGNPNGIGAVLDLTSKKNTTDEIYGIIGQMFSLAPVVSLDIPSFGPQTSYLSIFSQAAQPGNNENKTAAAKELIAAANWLTDGNFPSDFPIGNIFATSGVVVPTGVWADKSGERDIRDVDLAFVCAKNGDTAVMNKYVYSSLPRDLNGGSDPFINRVDVISRIMPDAEIAGKAIRVTFTADFITTLANAATAAGLDVRYEPEIVFTENTNIGLVGQHYQNTGITNASGFARQNISAGPNFGTGYSNMGFGRY